MVPKLNNDDVNLNKIYLMYKVIVSVCVEGCCDIAA